MSKRPEPDYGAPEHSRGIAIWITLASGILFLIGLLAGRALLGI